MLHELQIYSRSFGVLPVHLSSIILKDFGLVILPIHSDWTIDCTFPKGECNLVTLVAIIVRVLHKVTMKESLTVPGTNVGQTHSESLEGKSTISAWKISPRCKSVNKVANVANPPNLSPSLPIVILQCWISSPTSGFIMGGFVLLFSF
jgi:hypothetical protein